MAATAGLAQLTRFSLVHTLASLSILFFLALSCGRPRHRFAWLPLEIASRKTTSARPAMQGHQLHLTRHRVSPTRRLRQAEVAAPPPNSRNTRRHSHVHQARYVSVVLILWSRGGRRRTCALPSGVGRRSERRSFSLDVCRINRTYGVRPYGKKNEIRKQFVVSFPAQMEKLEAATRS
jgi:hypothetical protein